MHYGSGSQEWLGKVFLARGLFVEVALANRPGLQSSEA